MTVLCERAQELITQLEQISSPVPEVQLQVYQVNPSYSPSLLTKWKRQRRKLLDAIDHCEADGLQLRQTFRDGSHSPGTLKSDETNVQTEASSWAHADVNFDLPADRVFHVINLEHTLVKLTEKRSMFTQAWRQFTKRAGVVKLMADIEHRFIEVMFPQITMFFPLEFVV